MHDWKSFREKATPPPSSPNIKLFISQHLLTSFPLSAKLSVRDGADNAWLIHRLLRYILNKHEKATSTYVHVWLGLHWKAGKSHGFTK